MSFYRAPAAIQDSGALPAFACQRTGARRISAGQVSDISQPHRGVNSLDDLLSLVEAQLGDEPVDLLAQSMGGVIAMMVVLRHPTKVRRLVLSVTSAGLAMGRLGAADWRETYRLNYPNAAPWVHDVQVDLSAELGTVVQPTLLLWGDADPISPVSVGHYLRSLLPNAELQVLRGGDHDVVHTRSSEAGPLIQRHLEASS